MMISFQVKNILQPLSLQNKNCYRLFTSTSTLLSSSPAASSFEPPPPNTYHGTPVYENINISSANNDVAKSTSKERNSDPESVFVISGASRGMGLQYCKSLLHRTNGTIVACARNDTTPALVDLMKSNPDRFHIMKLDIADQSQIESVATEIESKFQHVDVLLNVAGILGDGGKTTPGPERNLKQLNREWLFQNMNVNAMSPLMLCQALAPLMQTKKGKKILRPSPSVIVNMSARVASIADNNQAGLGWHSYRMSKAALNMGTRVLSHELKRQGTWTLSLYPGFTDTDLSKPFQKGMKPDRIFPVDFTVGRMLDVVDSMEEKHSGGLFDWAGQALPF